VLGLALADDMGVEKLVAYCKGVETEGKGKLGCEGGPPTGGWVGGGGPGVACISVPNPESLRGVARGKGLSCALMMPDKLGLDVCRIRDDGGTAGAIRRPGNVLPPPVLRKAWSAGLDGSTGEGGKDLGAPCRLTAVCTDDRGDPNWAKLGRRELSTDP